MLLQGMFHRDGRRGGQALLYAVIALVVIGAVVYVAFDLADSFAEEANLEAVEKPLVALSKDEQKRRSGGPLRYHRSGTRPTRKRPSR